MVIGKEILSCCPASWRLNLAKYLHLYSRNLLGITPAIQLKKNSNKYSILNDFNMHFLCLHSMNDAADFYNLLS